MINKKKVLTVIPARSGSKGLPNKNIKKLLGHPLIAWSINSANKSKYVDDVVVSTDSAEIAQIANKYGARTPFLRPANLAKDEASTFDTLEHAINFISKEEGLNYDYILLIEPTSPQRTNLDIDNAFEKLTANVNASSIVGVAKTESQNPAFLIRMDKNNFISGYEDPKMPVVRRQDLKNKVFFFEGSIYISEINSFFIERSFYHKNTIGFEFPKWKSFEIDDLDDFIIIESLMKSRGYSFG